MTRARNGAAPAAPTRARDALAAVRGPELDSLLDGTSDGGWGRINGRVVEHRGDGILRIDGGEPTDPALAPRASRSGKRRSPFLNVQLPASEVEQRRFKAAAAEEGQALSRWLLEAARAYALMAERPNAELTDADWQEIVRQ